METSWVNRTRYPFESKYLEIDGQKMHYIDEGAGPVILFSHGTPEWSFGYRDLIIELRDQFRCIAPDLLGFGLSDKPAHADYSVRAHAARMSKFIDTLQLGEFHIVANDFGLGIALAKAIQNPELVKKISIFNSWMWPLDTDPHYARPARVMKTWLGKLLYLKFNFAVNIAMPAAFGDRKKLTPEVHRHYKKALGSPAERVAAYALSSELIHAGPFWAELWQQLPRISGKPFQIFWGMKDRFVPTYELDKWLKALPHAQVLRFENAGHFCQEEEPEKMVAALRNFLA